MSVCRPHSWKHSGDITAKGTQFLTAVTGQAEPGECGIMLTCGFLAVRQYWTELKFKQVCLYDRNSQVFCSVSSPWLLQKGWEGRNEVG